MINTGFVSALLSTILAMGLVSNTATYLFLPLLVLLLYRRHRGSLRSKHFWFVSSTWLFAIYGTLLGIMNGNNIDYILRFTAPLLALAIFLPARSLATAFFRHHRALNILVFLFSLFVYLLTVLRLNDLSLLLLRGWTLSFEAVSAVGIWHYFALPITGFSIYEFLYRRRTSYAFLHAIIGIATLIFLLMTTATSAFKLACVVLIVVMFLPRISYQLLSRILLLIVGALVFDYVSVKYLSHIVVDLITGITGDEGDLIRLVQINYFLENVNLTGHGFGVEHNFQFENPLRQRSHEAFPYASELPILNLIHAGGALAVIWVWFLCLNFINLLKSVLVLRGRDSSANCYFGFCCMLVLIGSISNPFLFSPISMLLIAIAFNILEHYGRTGTTSPTLSSGASK